MSKISWKEQCHQSLNCYKSSWWVKSLQVDFHTDESMRVKWVSWLFHQSWNNCESKWVDKIELIWLSPCRVQMSYLSSWVYSHSVDSIWVSSVEEIIFTMMSPCEFDVKGTVVRKWRFCYQMILYLVVYTGIPSKVHIP